MEVGEQVFQHGEKPDPKEPLLGRRERVGIADGRVFSGLELSLPLALSKTAAPSLTLSGVSGEFDAFLLLNQSWEKGFLCDPCCGSGEQGDVERSCRQARTGPSSICFEFVVGGTR